VEVSEVVAAAIEEDEVGLTEVGEEVCIKLVDCLTN
jgi:hypothetical protein